MHIAHDALALVAEKLKKSNLRPTKQRLILGSLLWSGAQPRHVTAEQLHAESKRAGMHVSLATVYNTLHQLTEVGLLRETVVDGGKTYFDTNTTHHHHMVNELTGEIHDIPASQIQVPSFTPPAGLEMSAMEVIVWVKPAA